ncbi:MAG: Ig-like domain repeat protein [Bryobacteraceae bacterium]
MLSAASLCFAQPTTPKQQHQRFVPGRILVKFKDGVSDEQVKTILAEKRVRSGNMISQIGVHIVELPLNADEETWVETFQGLKEVEFAEVDAILKPAAITPNDPFYATGSQWGLPLIGLPNAWSITTGSSAITIAIIDSGVQPNQPDLQAKLVPGWNVASNIADTSDLSGHGTEVAGAAAAITNNGLGVAGVCWGCLIMPVKVATEQGMVSASSIASGITWAADHGADVANASFQVTGNSTVSSAAQYLWSKGSILITAAGEGLSASNTPDNPYILEIGATDPNDVIYSWSNTGPYVDLVAPGCGETPYIASAITYACGTSYSAPIVTGVAALMLSVNRSLTPAQITTMLKSTATPEGPGGCNSTYGCGVVNALAAVQAAAGVGSKTNSTTTLTSSLNPSTSGQLVTFTAAVAPITATGSVTFLDGTSTLGSSSLSSGKATFSTSSLAAGPHSITASYSGDSNDTGGISGAVSQTVTANKASTTTAATSTLNPSTSGQSVTFTATVSPSSATGTVTFLDGTTALGSSTLSTGQTTFTTSGLAVGSHSITASYGGDNNFSGSTSAILTQTVNAAVKTKTSTTTNLSSSLNPSTSGRMVTFNSAITPSTATGTVTFYDGTTPLAVATLSGGVAAFSTASLAAGGHSITGAYSGDSNNNSSTSGALTQTVNAVSTQPPPVSTSCPSPANNAFIGCYFNNINLSGNPAFVRTDSQISFDWGNGSPASSLTPANFSVRWQGNFAFNAGTYAFSAVTSDGMRVYIDGNLLLSEWQNQPPSMYSFSTTLTAGSHLVVVEYYDQSDNATAMLWWWQN